jgi:hypothetical protein
LLISRKYMDRSDWRPFEPPPIPVLDSDGDEYVDTLHTYLTRPLQPTRTMPGRIPPAALLPLSPSVRSTSSIVQQGTILKEHKPRPILPHEICHTLREMQTTGRRIYENRCKSLAFWDL